MKRLLVMFYGAAAYVIFLAAFVYAIGFVGDIAVPRSVDDGIPASLLEALVVNAALLGLFAVQHSVMARPWFKRWWTRFVPQPIERSTFVLMASCALVLLYWQWRTMPTVVWDVTPPPARVAMWAAFWLGWMTVLATIGYILVAIRFEECDFIAALGAQYRDYRRRVPMLIPRPRRVRPQRKNRVLAQP